MTKVNIIMVSALFVVNCSYNHTKEEVIKKDIKIEKTIKERLDNYFDDIVTPAIIANNIEYHHNQREISFSNHKIKWIENDKWTESKIQIDDDLFSLKDEMTLNNIEGITKDKVDFANNWRQIKYFKYNDQELIGIEMDNYPCTGHGCSVSYFLLYDLKHKTKNFFGTYEMIGELQLFNFNNGDDGQLDFISKTNANKGVTTIYELFSLGEDGIFRIQKDSKGHEYQLKYTVIEDSTGKKETLDENWFEKIK